MNIEEAIYQYYDNDECNKLTSKQPKRTFILLQANIRRLSKIEENFWHSIVGDLLQHARKTTVSLLYIAIDMLLHFALY